MMRSHVCLSTAEKSAGELPICYSEGQCGGYVLQAPGGAVDNVPYNGGSQLRHSGRCNSCCQERVSVSVLMVRISLQCAKHARNMHENIWHMQVCMFSIRTCTQVRLVLKIKVLEIGKLFSLSSSGCC